MKRKLYLLTVLVIMVVCLLPAVALAEEDSSGYIFTPIDATTCRITDYIGVQGPGINNDIPSTLTDVTSGLTYTVVEIGDRAFYDGHYARITIPNSVISIGEYVFTGSRITSVVFTASSSLSEIGNSAFFNNSLTSITIPNSVTEIGTGAFGMNTLTSFVLPTPSGVTTTTDIWQDGLSNLYDAGETVTDLVTSYSMIGTVGGSTTPAEPNNPVVSNPQTGEASWWESIAQWFASIFK